MGWPKAPPAAPRSRPWISLVGPGRREARWPSAPGDPPGADQGLRRTRRTAEALMLGLATSPSVGKERTMSSSRTQPPDSQDLESRTDRSRRATPKALVWLVIVAIAAFPFPWWW